jgi:hypothetical protein
VKRDELLQGVRGINPIDDQAIRVLRDPFRLRSHVEHRQWYAQLHELLRDIGKGLRPQGGQQEDICSTPFYEIWQMFPLVGTQDMEDL